MALPPSQEGGEALRTLCHQEGLEEPEGFIFMAGKVVSNVLVEPGRGLLRMLQME